MAIFYFMPFNWKIKLIFKVASYTKPDDKKRSCYDCYHCQGMQNLWCMNNKAIKLRGTSIPGVIKCTEWKPCEMVKDLSIWKRFSWFYSFINKDKL